MEEDIRLNNSQLKVMQLVWEGEPIQAKELTVRAAERYGWNKNTTYTVLKSLVEKGVLIRDEPDFVCVAAISLERVRHTETTGLIDKLYKGSRVAFLSAFLEQEALEPGELEALRRTIDGK